MCGTKSAGLPFAAPMTSKIEMIRPIMLKARGGNFVGRFS